MKKNCSLPVKFFYNLFCGAWCWPQIYFSYLLWHMIAVMAWYITEYPVFSWDSIGYFVCTLWASIIFIFSAGLLRIVIPF